LLQGLSRDQDEGNAARTNPLNLLRTEEANVSAHGEPLLVQHAAIRAPDFHAPITAGHGLPAVRTKALSRIRPNRQAHGLSQRVSAIPAMLDYGVA